MSLFNRKTVLDDGLESYHMDAIDPLTAGVLVGAPILNNILTGGSASDAANISADATKYATDVQNDQWNQTQSNLAPFLESATGTPIYEFDDAGWETALSDYEAGQAYDGLPDRYDPKYYTEDMNPASGNYGEKVFNAELYNQDASTAAMTEPNKDDFYTKNVIGYEEGTGALPTYLDQVLNGSAPTPPQLDSFNYDLSQAPQAPTLAAPGYGELNLQDFNFNVEEAMNSPELAFMRQQGEQQLDRLSAKNRQLGSGNRLYDVLNYNEGLVSTNLADQYNRQLGTYNTNRQSDLANYGSAVDLYNTNQNRDIKNYSLQDQQFANDYARNLGMYDTNQRTALNNYGLDSGVYNDRMNRLAGLVDVGRGTGTAMGSLGAQNASSISNLLMNQGNVSAAATMAGANNITGLLNTGVQTAGMMYNPYGGGYDSMNYDGQYGGIPFDMYTR